MKNINHVLIVDNNLEDRAVYEPYVAQSFKHLSIQMTETGKQALDYLKTHDVDCILLDYQLPDMNGIEFLTTFKKSNTHSIPVIMLTKIGNEKIAVEALKSGAYDYLNKNDLRAEVLYNTIANAVEKSRLIRQLKEKESEINYLAYHDYLTGAPNRAHFEDCIKEAFIRAERYGRTFALLLIDLDRFKWVNDNYGHETGDALLKEVTQLFQQCIRKSDMLARLGGDEFAIFTDHIENPEDIGIIANKLIKILSKSLKINGHTIKTSPSIGIAFYPESKNLSRLLSDADIALYQAKNNGKNTFCYFSNTMTHQSMERMKIENAFYEAIEKQNFYLCYQPMINLATNDLFSMELLLRSNHPVLKKIPINNLMDIAHKTGLIFPLNTWILETAFQQLVSWREKKINPFKLSINLSINQLKHKDWLPTFQTLIKRYKIDPRELIFELGESEITFNFDYLNEQLSVLTNLGCDIMIDNFGEGYSSLDSIRQLTISGVKLARSFIKDIETRPYDVRVIKAISLLAQALDLYLVANGIETKGQLQILEKFPHIFGQGFYFSKPLEMPVFMDHKWIGVSKE